jgi:CelD/BcsL family acetyltransferase involved in cellulose biosynthesis
MRLTWTIGLPPDENLRDKWNTLVLQMEKPEVFYTWEWAAAFIRSYGDSVQPWIATAYDEDELIGVVALARSSASEAVFLNGTTADYCDFISAPARRKEFVGHVLRSLAQEGIVTMVLANLPAESASVDEIKHNKTFKSFLRTGYICAHIQLGSEEDKKTLSETLFKKKVLRHSMNALQRIGRVTLSHDLGAGLERGVVERFCKTHIARFLATGRISNLANARRRVFLRELAGLLAESGWFDLSTLRAGTFVLGMNYGFRFQGSRFWYQPTIVNKFEEYSPGYCLLGKIIQDACADPEAKMVDLGLGAEEYKERFANGQRTTLHGTLSRKSSDLWKARARYHVAQRITGAPRLESFARRAQTLVQKGRRSTREYGWPKTLALAGRTLQQSALSTAELLFFRWNTPPDEPKAHSDLLPISWDTLAEAAMRYSEDRETMDYLLRVAPHLRSEQARGYALTAADGAAGHFAWVIPYEGFSLPEFAEILHAPSKSSVLIVDCWTPRELRRRGLYSCAIRQLSQMLCSEGKDVWTFTGAENHAAVRLIGKAGFQRQSAILRRKFLWWMRTRIENREPVLEKHPDAVSNQVRS